MSGAVQLTAIGKTFPNGARALRNVHLRLPARQLTTLLAPQAAAKPPCCAWWRVWSTPAQVKCKSMDAT